MEDRSLSETPTWAVAVVVTAMVVVGSFFHVSLKHFRKWLDKTKRKALIAAMDKIKDELMLFGLMSLLMGHWIGYVAKICIKTSPSERFYLCAVRNDQKKLDLISSGFYNSTDDRDKVELRRDTECPEGHEPFASKESLEQLHRFIFVLGVIHVSYSFFAIALAIIKIYSWRKWEHEAKALAAENLQDNEQDMPHNLKLMRVTTFVAHHVSHPWSQHKVFVWLLCFSRQFWSSISRADYMALRLGFLTTHNLPLTYDFHNYMLRSMEAEFRDFVGISVPFWIYAILCIFLEFHGSNAYFWLSFLPAILILLIGTKLHRVVVKLAVEVMYKCPRNDFQRFDLRDDLFWFGKPKLLLWLIKLISFQNAFEMATFVWSMWEVRNSSCFMDSRIDVVIRLTFGLTSQFWCSYITFPLYVIVTEMGSKFKRTIVTESVRCSLSHWQKRVNARRRIRQEILKMSAETSSDPSTTDNSNSRFEELSILQQVELMSRDQMKNLSADDELYGHVPLWSLLYDDYREEYPSDDDIREDNTSSGTRR